MYMLFVDWCNKVTLDSIKLKIVWLFFYFQILFVTINADEEDHQRILEFFGMKKDEIPAMRIIKMAEDMSKYKPEKQDFSAEYLKNFVEQFIDGKLKVKFFNQHLILFVIYVKKELYSYLHFQFVMLHCVYNSNVL